MNDSIVLDVLAASERRRVERRAFMRSAANASIAAGGLSLLAACGNGDNSPTPTPAPTPAPSPTPSPSPSPTVALTDADILNFALNLEYLEAQFYSFAVNGTGLPASMTGSGGAAGGAVTGGAKVNFTDPVVAQYAREIAADELAHVTFLRTALGSAAVAQPALNISGDLSGPFTAAARAAGVTSGDTPFNPYASDEAFLLGAFIFEDVGVTAYKGASFLLSSKTYLDAAAGILAAEAYHAGLVRTVLYAKGIPAGGSPSLRPSTDKISNARDSLDGPDDRDQGLNAFLASGAVDTTMSNIVPTDSSGLVYSRSAGQVLNIVYLNKTAVSSGGFFPNGTNGTIRTSAASG